MKTEQHNGIEIPKLGFGTWQIKGTACEDMVGFALDHAGYRHIDTAQIYENELEVGNAIQRSAVTRDDVFLTTKIWLDQMTGDKVITSLEESLTKLQTEYCDLVLVHWPNEDVPFEDTLTALQNAVDQGKTRMIGISNFNIEQVKKVRDHFGFDIAMNQCEYHPFLDQSDLIKTGLDRDILFTAYCPIAQGQVLSDKTLVDIAAEHGVSAVQVTLRWLYQQEGMIAIPRSSKEKNVKANIDILGFELSSDEMQRIFDLTKQNNRLINPGFAPKWDVAA